MNNGLKNKAETQTEINAAIAKAKKNKATDVWVKINAEMLDWAWKTYTAKGYKVYTFNEARDVVAHIRVVL